ncbi:aldo/keto reductase [Desulfurococcus amylolyticus 1221n]|uniref:Aldo/keto reductase n=1 Tax=Desulfurococcus amylolyticus (strain DSM 18924 / JCM 16383 / VKM B-2413 / 1221n) TaxID=490899 RepID=B8D658_DESA1|nr:aldo/keto reductase [Desulfurococcus amylolyticus]ACL11589.1 aldo/keto reductase [Desulfurococcus amylolyticus 1221n]
MEYTTLGWTDEKISRIGLGTWQYSETWGLTDYDVAKKVIGKAIEVGINFFDTAMVYGRGMSEEFLGKALRELGVKRDEVFIATKIPGEFLNPDDVFKSVDRSLRRLGVNSIDLLQLHWPPCWHNYPTTSYARALERLIIQGKIRYIGVSNYPVALIEELRSALSITDIVSMQYRFNLAERWAEEELIPYAEANDLTFIPWSPLAKGALTGKYALENIGLFRDLRTNEAVFHPSNFEKLIPLINALKELASKYGKTPSQVALNWLVRYSPVIVPIPGAKTPEQVVENAGAVGWELSFEDWMMLYDIAKNIKVTYVTW